jgi:hypothetical protein
MNTRIGLAFLMGIIYLTELFVRNKKSNIFAIAKQTKWSVRKQIIEKSVRYIYNNWKGKK